MQSLKSVEAGLELLWHLQLSDFLSDKTPSEQRHTFKPLLITHYQPEAPEKTPSLLKCMVTGVSVNYGDVVVGALSHTVYAGLGSQHPGSRRLCV